MGRRESFSAWFEENSGYALHRSNARNFSVTTCCGEQPVSTGQSILYPHPQKGGMEPFALYRCPKCKAFYVQWENKYARINQLMKYQLLPRQEK